MTTMILLLTLITALTLGFTVLYFTNNKFRLLIEAPKFQIIDRDESSIE